MRSRWLPLLIISSLWFLHACIDPVPPEFDYVSDIIFIDAYAVTEAGSSFVKIERSNIVSNSSRTDLVPNATVTVESMDDGTVVNYTENEEGIYVPPADFRVFTGETWRLIIELEDGRRYESQPEEVTEAVELNDMFVEYDSEVTFLESEQAFVPGHKVSIQFNDPAQRPNYYLWRYTTFENLSICRTCIRGRFRNDKCDDSVFFRDFDYLCEVPCWFIRNGNAFQLYDDQLSDGQSNIELEVATLPYWTNTNIVIELEQLNLSEAGYEFYSIIDDVLNESSGLNAPPPASLIGNLFNPDNPTEAVLGQFNAVALKTYGLFIERENLADRPIEATQFPRLEESNDPSSIFLAPCEETNTRTAIRPRGWQ